METSVHCCCCCSELTKELLLLSVANALLFATPWLPSSCGEICRKSHTILSTLFIMTQYDTIMQKVVKTMPAQPGWVGPRVLEVFAPSGTLCRQTPLGPGTSVR